MSNDISWLHLLIVTLASFRLTHLLVFDDIMSKLRGYFLLVEAEANEETGELDKKKTARGSGIRKFIGTILSCYWCTGIWSSAIIATLYLLMPLSFPILFILAIAGASAIIETRLYS